MQKHTLMGNSPFERLVEVMARLRAPDGCPWDREQTHTTLKPYLIEEAYEVLQAIDDNDDEELKAELGDILLQVVFHSQIATETGRFAVDDVIQTLCAKLIRRHPHVFGETEVSGTHEVLQNWESIKAQEKAAKAEANGTTVETSKPASFLDNVSPKMPPLIEARQLTERAAYVKFDWERPEDCLDKLHEEVDELKAELAAPTLNHLAIADEVGDLLFVAVNIARLLKVDPDSALKNANRKFRRRFGYIEQALAREGKTIQDSNLEEMERYWQEAKQGEKG